jgi:hypothetical protein
MSNANEAIVVFTAKSASRIIEEGGTSSWRLDRSHARQCGYAICTRNTHADWAEGTEAHHSAFLVGKIRDVVPCEPTPENDESPNNRFLIQFSEYAIVDIPEVWKGDRNPVKYADLSDLGISPATLKWKKMPEVNEKADSRASSKRIDAAGIRPLSMAEAKKGLALTFGVAPEAIEITIRG